MDFLSQNDFTKFKNERISSNNNELNYIKLKA